MSARTELLALLACVTPLDTARNMVDRHHAEARGPVEAAAANVLALHRKHADSDHCFADDEAWPCQTRMLLDPTGLLAAAVLTGAVHAMGALPMPTGDPLSYGPSGVRCGCGKDAHSNIVPCAPVPVAMSPWERAVAGLNALADAKIPFAIEPDGHIAKPFGDEHIEWDQDASRWRLVHDDEDDDTGQAPAPGALAEQRNLLDPLDHALEHLADNPPAEAALLAAIVTPDPLLTSPEREFLTFALELAADQMASRGDEFDDDDRAALTALHAMAAEPDDDGMDNADVMSASELYDMDRDDEIRFDAEDDAR